MKRSEINTLIDKAKTMFQHNQIRLPPFAFWKPEDWAKKGPEADEIRNNKLGWDLTDFGSGCFAAVGLLLFTIRNGNLKDPSNAKNYAEKIMLVEEGQVTPFHFHWQKTEDIIKPRRREPDYRALPLRCHRQLHAAAGGLFLRRRETRGGTRRQRRAATRGSITLVPRVYHKFYGQHRSGRVIVGEVSSVNDDASDNRFKEAAGRFPQIEEDAPPLHYLCNEYPRAQ